MIDSAGRSRAPILVLAAVLAALAGGPARAAAAPEPAYGPELQGYDYPFPVAQYRFTSQRQELAMAFLDVRPAHPNGRTAVLLHGKNFCSATWEPQIRALTAAGFRVIAPDQVGFCKSSKPSAYQFSFQQLAGDTRALLRSLGVERFTLVGHSTGGMLAIRYALMFPADLDQLVLVDPIGLEDWSAKGVPWVGVDAWYRRELATTADRIRAYEQATYYAGTWEPRFEPPVRMLAGLFNGSGRSAVAWDSALLYDMIQTEPVVYELERLSMPILLMVGDKDTTAIGKEFAPPAARAGLGDYKVLAGEAAKRIPHATLVEFPDYGHAPQIQAPDVFNAALLKGLGTSPP